MAAIPPTWFQSVLGALILSLLVAIALRRIRLPYTIALVIVGLGVGWLGEGLMPEGIELSGLLSAEVILFILLPPLLFEGASAMHINQLRANWKPITLLAIPGVILNTAVIGLICWKLVWPDTEYGMLYGLLIGSVLAATDPVSVLALVKSLGAPKRLSVLLEGESLFNDGTAVVFFNILLIATLTALAGDSLNSSQLLTQGISSFIFVVTVGAVVGLICGMVANHLLAATEDHLVEIALTVALAFGSFLLAETLGGSGVISVVVAGLLVGNHGVQHGMTLTARIGLHHFWEVVVFLVNSVLFLLVGYELQSVMSMDTHMWTLGGIAIMAALLARLVVFPLTALSNIGSTNPISTSWRTAMWWGGLRGSIPIALLLLLSHIVHDGTALEGFSDTIFLPEAVYEDMLVRGFSVVLFSLIVQGLTMKPMLNRLGITGVLSDSEARYERALADVVGSRAALSRLSTLHMQGRISDEDHIKLAEPYRDRMSAAESRVKDLSESSVVHAGRVESARRDLLTAQIQALREAEREGTISTLVARRVLSSLEEALSESEFTREAIRATVPSPEEEGEASPEPPVPEDTASVTGVSLSELDEEE